MIISLIDIQSTLTLSWQQMQVCVLLHVTQLCINLYSPLSSTGHGFKLAPVIGKILTEMIMELPLSYDITRFSLKRFNNKKS